MTAASVNRGNGTTSSYAASDDDHLRLLSSSLSASGSTRYQVPPGYDAASNETAVDTTLSGNVTDNQAFCYDEQNRLV